MTSPFPHLRSDFEFGVTTSALGIEGGADREGRTPSVWDAVAAAPGRIVDGTTGADAVDHHTRYGPDIDLLARLGAQSYRFSVSWSRVQPGGVGPPNPAGLAFYDRLLDRLLEAGVDPWVTLYHWDLPVELMMQGGWLDRDTADRLGDLAVVVADRLGDRVRRWTTMADPVLHMGYGHAVGVDPPGLTLLGEAIVVTHHLLLGHARVRAVLAGGGHQVGIANHHTLVGSASDTPADRTAAALYDSYHNRQFTDPILIGRYPRLLQNLLDRQDGLVQDGDLAAISAPLDFYGVDYFHPTTVAAAPENNSIPFAIIPTPDRPVTDFDAPVEPAALTAVLVELTRRYPRLPPLFVTENGAAYDDRPGEPDTARIEYLRAHLAAVDDAVAAGADVRGYFHRGLTDAWEGTEGYTRQFGLVAIDPITGERTPRASYEAFRASIAGHRGPPPG
ncbi:beta-glucosidase [Nakamurella panacisegetis]|uniref:beta-glucosidase n=1 Tax=Nakamurella panacisegetis TaxID=1090615 RepID=A0A1H0JJQ4_9ACTN|nr:family 1 glycosylhydrolase [Nakamurella panacisegetis]SDO43946.1 beta-glucosidase [Nakamurella panacisegetis]